MSIDIYFEGAKKGQVREDELPDYYRYFKEAGYSPELDLEGRRLTVKRKRAPAQALLELNEDSVLPAAKALQASARQYGLQLEIKGEDYPETLIIPFQIAAAETKGSTLTIRHNGCRAGKRLAAELAALPGLAASVEQRYDVWEMFSGEPFVEILLEAGKDLNTGRIMEQLGFCLSSALNYKNRSETLPWEWLFDKPQPAPAMPAAMPSIQPQQSQTPAAKGELFLDYQFLFTRASADSPFYLIGKAIVKNTGNVPFQSPLLCLRLSPASKARLQGKILTPKQAAKLGAKERSSMLNGWKYIEDNPLEKAKETGEYWVQPLNAMQVPPGSQTSLDFQLYFTPLASGQAFTCDAFFAANGQKVKISSNNRIVISG
ncbi:hypothetical protein LRR81_13340 [Metabacillus sp. GX 13764]|uniref:hypothetical protein n=1 Tax=Metabacillus kandeliae TaxID=2900151 RepID=UPI001E2C0703|nr:hypothetical protein [Metabacillus kandeliae]MCD7035225.1 hypothetical protein [Metabacillus kandeliae]